MYKCEKYYFESILQPKIKRIIRKLKRYNKQYKFEILSTTVERIPVFNEHHISIGDVFVDVINYNFEMEEIKHGNFEVIAFIKHQENGNLVHSFRKDREEIGAAFRYKKGNCDHCKINRRRVKTFILVDMNTAEVIQVGKSCINEYLGIDILKIAGIKKELDIIMEDNQMEFDEERSKNVKSYYFTKDVLQAAIEIIKDKGYNKEEIREDVENRLSATCTEKLKYEDEAQKVIEYFKNLDDSTLNEFEYNSKIKITNEHTKWISGYICYSYLLYNKMIDKKIEKNDTKYVGEIGQRRLFELTLKNVTAYDSVYGMQYYNEFVDNDNNIIIWKTDRKIKEGTHTIKGTIKTHKEFRHKKQTYITRCKII
jgi:hypothetical protein